MAIDPEGFGKRLTEARDARGWDTRTLHEKLVEHLGRQAKGASYGSVYSYVTGRGPEEPRREIVEGLAGVLGYSASWLLHGVGHKSPRHEVEEEAEADGPSLLDDVIEGVADGIGKGADHLLAPGVRRAAVVYTWRVLIFSVLGERLWREGQRGEGPGLPAMIGKALRAPFDVLGEDPGEVPEAAVTEYVLGACTALRALAHETPPPSPSIKEESHGKA